MTGTMLYQKISKDNRIKYGTQFEKVLKIIINQYSDRTHFIYEILQNAEDAGATHIKFHLERERLVIYHNGRPFDEKDIEGVCGIASGTKEDGTRIGHFGIGFKSVYCYTERPHIYSGKYRFAIVNQLFPEEVGALAGLAASETCMILPFDKEGVPANIAYQEISAALTKKITADSLLMLSNIADVEIKIVGLSDVITINKERYPLDKASYPDNVFGLSVQTTYTNTFNLKERHQDADYLFFTDAEKEASAIIFNVEEKELKPIKNSKVYAYFPTAKEAHQGFYIHAPFDTTPARDNFKEGAEYGKHNLRLVKNIGSLIWFAFIWMRDHGYLSPAGFRNVFPVYEYEEGDVLHGLYQNSIDIITEEAVIPTSQAGKFELLSNICFPESGIIMDIFDANDMRRLTGNKKASWIAREFTTDAYTEIRTFLNSNFKLTKLEWKDLVLKLDATFLKEKPLSWAESLMSRIEGYCIQRAGSDTHFFNVSNIPFVRTTTGDQICARDGSGKLQVYLNNPNIARYRIESSFIKNDIIRGFYGRVLRIPEYNVEQEALENILPKYNDRHPKFWTEDPLRENIEDLKIIKDAILANPSVTEKMADKYIVTDGRGWFLPSQLYIRSDDVRTGYSLIDDVIDIRYLSDHYYRYSLKLDEAFFRRIGCKYGIQPLTVRKGDYLTAVSKYCGTAVYADLNNHIFSKTYISQKMNWAFSYQGFPEVFRNITRKKSVNIAKFLNANVELFSIQGELVGAEDQHFSGKNVDSRIVYSMLGLQLCFNKWIYIKGDPNPHSPGDINVGDILDDYTKFSRRLMTMLPFKEEKNGMIEWLEENISDKKSLDLVKRVINNPEDLVHLAKIKAKMDAKEASKGGKKSVIDLLKQGDKKQSGEEKKTETDIAPISEKAKEKREKKLDEEFENSMKSSIDIPRGLSYARRESSEEERQFLEQEYGGRCQICNKMIIKYNGKPYFEAINIIKTNEMNEGIRSTIRRGWNSLCLCPNCAAEYNNCSKQISTLYQQVITTEVEADSEYAIGINFEMPIGKTREIKYSPKHIVALREAFKIFGKEQDK